MKRTTVITLAVLVAFAGSAHAIRPNPGTPAILGEIEMQLRGMEQKIQALQAETSTLRFENRRLRTQVSNLIAINDHVSLVQLHGRPTVRLSAVNLQVVNGAGDTASANGTGNLIIGYDKLRKDNAYGDYEEECSLGREPYDTPIHTRQQCEAANAAWKLDHKGGSHYLVVGDEHNYTRWSGIIAGYGSTANSRWASVTGGYRNQATGPGASVSGGSYGVAEGALSNVGGGDRNRATGDYATVSGGWQGVASGGISTVSGGFVNEASGIVSAVSGGVANKATKDGASVSGGTLNTASGHWSSVSGGLSRTADQIHGWAGGEY